VEEHERAGVLVAANVKVAMNKISSSPNLFNHVKAGIRKLLVGEFKPDDKIKVSAKDGEFVFQRK
jgi:hypothetical protein